jgi:hypothetical protein
VYILVEVDALLVKQDIIFDDIVPVNFDTVINNLTKDNYNLFTNSGSGSGGYAHHIFCNAAKELFNINIDKVEFKPLRFVLNINDINEFK